MEPRTALLLGASGLTGQILLNLLLDDPFYTHVIVYVRKAVKVSHPKLEQQIVHYDKLDTAVQADDVFCCLGTTIKKAGSQQVFRQVDLVYPQKVAELQVNAGSQRLFVISALGADEHSSIFYSRTKGQLEKALMTLGYSCLCIFRPSLIMGERDEKRIGEQIGKVIAKIIEPILIGFLRKYRAVTALSLAKSMLDAAHHYTEGEHIITSDTIGTY